LLVGGDPQVLQETADLVTVGVQSLRQAHRR